MAAFDETRAGTDNIITGNLSNDSVAALVENFPAAKFVVLSELTPTFLDGIDILALTPATPLSASEQAALLGYVTAGGRALLMGDGYSGYFDNSISFFSPFGVIFAREPTGNLIVADPIAPEHPLINGPFGSVSDILVRNSGEFADLGPYAESLIEIPATDGSVFAVIEQGAIGPTSGALVLIADSNPFLDDDIGGFFNADAHRALFLNSIDFLAVPEPNSFVLLGLGGAVSLVLATLRRRQSRS